MRRLVPRGGGCIYHNGVVASRRGKDVCGKTGRFVLQDDISRRVQRIIDKARAGMEGEQIRYVFIFPEELAAHA